MSVIVPLGESPDEPDHFRYVQYLAQTRRFPVMSPIAAENATMEANQPPLYYLLGAAITTPLDNQPLLEFAFSGCFSFDPDDPGRNILYRHSPAEQFPWQGPYLAFHLVRILSLLFGAGTVALAYRLGRQLVPGQALVAPLAAALLAFNPQFIFITASVNNDALAALLGAAIVSLSVDVSQHLSSRRLALLGIAIGLGLLTKYSLLALWPLAALSIIRYPLSAIRLHSLSRFTFHVSRLTAYGFLLPLLLAAPWYWRNWRLYGDPLAWDIHLAAKGASVVRQTPFGMDDLFEFIGFHFQSYWARFGWLNIASPDWVYWLLALLVALGLAGLLLITFHVSRFRQSPVTIHQPSFIITLLAVAAIYLALLRYIQTINWSGYQGRLAYPVAAPVAALLALGLWRLLGNRWARLPALGLAFLALGSLLIVGAAYPQPHIYQPGPEMVATCARFEDSFELAAFDAPASLMAGERLPVTLSGYGLQEAHEGRTLRAQLVDPAGHVLAQADRPVHWEAGAPTEATLTLTLPETVGPMHAWLQAGLLNGDGVWQPAATIDGRSLDSPLTLTAIKIPAGFPGPPDHQVEAQFGDELALIGYDHNMPTITLYWQALAPIEHDYTTFVHLLDDAGDLLAQSDGQPHGGAYPTSIWDQGEVVTDEKELTSAVAMDGSYRLAVGVYRLDTGERLPVRDARGNLLADNRLLLPVE